MTMQTARPRGRRPGNDDTRGTIATAALDLFDRHGYDATSLRAVARHAQVDPALVHHYFASKAQLLTSVLLQSDVDIARHVDSVVAGDRNTIGVRVAKLFFQLWEHPDYKAPLLTFLSASDSHLRRSRLLGEFLAREIFGRLASSLGHRHGVLRGQLAATTMIGLVTARDVHQGGLASASLRSLIEPVGRVLQDYLVEEW